LNLIQGFRESRIQGFEDERFEDERFEDERFGIRD